MASQDEFLENVWRKYINSYMEESWIDDELRMSERYPSAPFADLGPLLTKLLALGATRRDLSLFARAIAYGTAFGTLYSLEDPGIENNDLCSLHESILSADPSGMEGRLGSAPAKEI
jgi:hypothetical protein